MAHPVDIYVGMRLRLRRTLLGLSQEAIGKAIGVTFQQIQKYERGINRMGSSRLYEFAKIMYVPVSYFFEGFEENSDKKTATGMAEEPAGFEHENKIGREALELMRAYYRITDPTVRKRMYDLIKSLANDSKAA